MTSVSYCRPPFPAAICFLLALSFLSACSSNTRGASESVIKCDNPHCSAVAKPETVNTSKAEGPEYYLGSRFFFSLPDSPKSVRYSPTSLIIELNNDRVLVAMPTTPESLGLPEKHHPGVRDMFRWYFLEPFSKAQSEGLPPKILKNIKAFKTTFKLGNVRHFRQIQRGPLTLIAFYSPEDALHRLYVTSRDQPGTGYTVDLRGFDFKEVQNLLELFKHP